MSNWNRPKWCDALFERLRTIPKAGVPLASEALLSGVVALACAQWLVVFTGAPPGSIVYAVFLGFSVPWAVRQRSTVDRAHAIVALAVGGGIGGLVVNLLALNRPAGDLGYALVLGLAVWIRRFGPRATWYGTCATLPLIAELITSWQRPTLEMSLALWRVVVALIPGLLVTIIALARPATGSDAAVARPLARTSWPFRPRPSTRMAIQLFVSLAAAFAVAGLFFPEHRVWVPLTAYIVNSGSRGRKGLWTKSRDRLIGAAAGTILAQPLTGIFLPGATTEAVIVAVLTVGVLLRPGSYALWAAATTAALTLLYAYAGVPAPLLIRLGAIVTGAVLAVAVGELLLPVPPRTHRI